MRSHFALESLAPLSAENVKQDQQIHGTCGQ